MLIKNHLVSLRRSISKYIGATRSPGYCRALFIILACALVLTLHDVYRAVFCKRHISRSIDSGRYTTIYLTKFIKPTTVQENLPASTIAISSSQTSFKSLFSLANCSFSAKIVPKFRFADMQFADDSSSCTRSSSIVTFNLSIAIVYS